MISDVKMARHCHPSIAFTPSRAHAFIVLIFVTSRCSNVRFIELMTVLALIFFRIIIESFFNLHVVLWSLSLFSFEFLVASKHSNIFIIRN